MSHTQKTWIDDSTCKEIGLAEDFKEKKEKAEVVEFPEEQAEKLESLYDDDLICVTSDFTGSKFIVEEVYVYDEEKIAEALS